MNETAIGHNMPPSDIEILTQDLRLQYTEILNRADELVSALDRVPPELTSDEQASKATDFISLIAACDKRIEAAHKKEKEPYLSKGRAVDSLFNAQRLRLSDTKTAVNRRVTAFLQKKAAEEKRKRDEEAERLRKEAADRLREAQEAEAAQMSKLADEKVSEAVVVTQQAEQAQRQAEAKPAQMARSVGTYGGKQTLTTYWVGKIEDRNKIDWSILAPYMSMDAIQKAVDAAVKAGVRNLPGVAISEEQKAVLR